MRKSSVFTHISGKNVYAEAKEKAAEAAYFD